MSSDLKAEQIPLPFTSLGDAARSAVASVQAASWPLPRQMALLKLRHSELSIKVLERLERGTARPAWKDYFDLKTSGYALRHIDGKRNPLILTPRGRMDADHLARAWAKELNLHVLTYGEDRYSCVTRCTCGASFTSRKSVTGRANANSQASRHLRDVEDGTWKPFDLNGFLDRYQASLDAQLGGS